MAIELHPVRGHVRIRPPRPATQFEQEMFLGSAGAVLIVALWVIIFGW